VFRTVHQDSSDYLTNPLRTGASVVKVKLSFYDIPTMTPGKIVVLMGSTKDFDFASRIGKFLQEEEFELKPEYFVASAHKTPERLLKKLEELKGTCDQLVFVTVAGLSDALSGVVAGNTNHPVIACPPDSEKFGWAKIFSSTITPQGVAVAYVPRPENAALYAAKILGLFDKALEKNIANYMKRLKESVAPM